MFLEGFNNLTSWTFGSGPSTKLTVANSAPQWDTFRAFANHDGTTAWSAARIDLTGAGVPTTTYWISFAFYLDSWAPVFAGADKFIPLLGYINANDDPMKGLVGTDDVWTFAPFLKATSSSAGGIIPNGSSVATSVSAGVWHTVRYGFKLNGASSHETLYLDNVQINDFNVNYSSLGAGGSTGMYGLATFSYGDGDHAVLYLDAASWSPGADPGEPVVATNGNGNGNGGSTFVGPVVTTFIDGTEVTDCVRSGSVTRRLNRPWQASVQLYSDCAIGNACSRLKINITEGTNTTLWFHGFVTQISTEAGEDGAIISEYTALDPMMLWQWRPARDGPDTTDPGDFSKPDFFTELQYGPLILKNLLEQSESGSPLPLKGEGPLFIDLAGATYATGVTSLRGAPTDWPMTISECFELMSSTGVLDAVLTPIDVAGNMASLAVYNGDYGTDLTASVNFDYATGDHNVRTVRMTEDSTNVVNKLWYYLGPRQLGPTDPAGDQHWRANITGQSPEFDPAGSAEMVPPGGRSVDATNAAVGPPWTDNQLGERIYDSRTGGCGVRMEVRIYDAQGDENPAEFKELYQRLWQEESWLRAIPRTLVHVTPIRQSDNMQLPPGVTPVAVGAFDIGDLVTVTAGSIVRGGFTGAQRIYEYTVSWDEDGIVEVGELLTSSDQEGLQ